MKRSIIYLMLVALMLTATSFARVSKTGTTVAPFLSFDVGSRAVGMGGAYVALAEGATAMFWNSAGIARSDLTEAVFSHANWIADVNFNFTGITLNLGSAGVLGANATFMSMDDMQVTTVYEPEGVPNSFFSAGSYALGLSYARELTDRFSIGFNGKYINEKIWECSASGFAFDVGTLFTTPFNGLKIGMNISNYGSKMQMSGKNLLVQHDLDSNVHGNNDLINARLSTDKFDLPLLFRVGVAMDVLQGRGDSNLTLAVDALHPNNNHESVNAGIEYAYKRIFFLRGGYNHLFLDDSEAGLSLGAGLSYTLFNTSLSFDYAYRDFKRLLNIQMFTLTLGF